MVQNWENFMDPYGGSRDTTWSAMGTGGIAADLLISFGVLGGIARSLKNNIQSVKFESISGAPIIKPIGSELPILRRNFIVNQVTGFRFGLLHRKEITDVLRPETYKKLGLANQYLLANKRHMPRKIDVIDPTIRKLTNTKNLMKFIGKSYLAMGAAYLAKELFAPTFSLTQSAQRSEQNMGPQMFDTEIAYTQRQRALMAIHDSQLGLKGTIGNESQYFHK